jgi:hypothetical protein
MTNVYEFLHGIITYSVVSTFCMHLLPGKKYRGYADFAVGLVYVCMILDMLQEIMSVWKIG